MKTCEGDGCASDKIIARGLCAKHYSQARRAGKLDRRTTEELFLAKTIPAGECIAWTGGLNKDGYGIFRFNGTPGLAHRYAWIREHGPIGTATEIDHRCHNRACVNPAHLRTAGRKLNMEHQAGAHKGSTSGVRGVYWNKDRQKWQVQVRHNKIPHYGGLFDDLAEAERVAKSMRLELFTRNDADRKAD